MNRLLFFISAFCLTMAAHGTVYHYTVFLDGPSESPPNASPATGFATVSYDDVADTLGINVVFSGLTGTTTASHIHAPTSVAFSGTAGVATTTPTFAGFPSGVTSGSYNNVLDLNLATSYNPSFVTANGGTTASAKAALVAAIAAGKAYLNIHTTTFGGGEIRGFLLPACSTITLSPAVLPDGATGASYSQNVTAGGGTSPYSYAASGTLPGGLTLSSGGVLSGTPINSGLFSFTITATDTNSCTGSSNYSITVTCPTITLSPATLPGGVVGSSYSQSLAGSGGTEFSPTVGFTTSSTLSVGDAPASVITADVNGDGKLDLINANTNTPILTVLTNNGNGGFVLASLAGGSLYPVSVAAADFNLDGKVDLVSANYGANSLTVLTNDGNGVFSLAATISMPFPNLVKTADVNDDGKPDLLASSAVVSGLMLMMTNDGAGGFVTMSGAPSFVSPPISFTTADINLDGRVDIMGVISSGQLLVFTNAFNHYQQAYAPIAISGPMYVTSGDLNGDSQPDLVVVANSGGSLSIMTNSGSGFVAFGPPPPVLAPLASVTTADINADGKVDLVGVSSLASSLLAWTNSGTGMLLPILPSISVGSGPVSVAAGDFNGDGKVDAVSADRLADTLTVLTNSGSGYVPYLMSVTSGALPGGLNLANNGALTGTLTSAGTFNFTLTATDKYGCTGSSNYTINAVCPTITLSPATLAGGTAGVSYADSVLASGGAVPYSYAVTSGALPGGVDLSSGGALSGTPINSGLFSFTITATDAYGCTGSSNYVINVVVAGGGDHLLILTNGTGTLKATASKHGTPIDGAVLKPGTNYTVTAFCASNHVFSNWVYTVTGETNYTSSANKLTFTFQSNLVLTANFDTNRFYDEAGTYYGLITGTGGVSYADSGFVQVKVKAGKGKPGKFSAKVMVEGRKWGGAGTFNAAGVGQLNTPILRTTQGKDPLTLQLVLPFDGQSISGTLYNTDAAPAEVWVGELEAYRGLLADKTSVAGTGYDGNYTLVVPSTGSEIGDGYGILNITNSKVKLAGGKLADNQGFKQTGIYLTAGGLWPLVSVGDKVSGEYHSLFMGWVDANDLTNGTTTTNLIWVKTGDSALTYTDGFSNVVELEASPYSDPGLFSLVLPLDESSSTNVNGTVYLWDGGLDDVLTNTVSLGLTPTGKNKFTDTNGKVYGLKLSVNTKMGKLGGAFKAGSNGVDSAKIGGVVMPNQGTGRGYFLQILPTPGTNTGTFLLEGN